MLNDQPAGSDSLGFEPYVEATAFFLTQEATKPPLTMSVEGPWGSGKSSFMRQLSAALTKRGGLTIDFNPWRHEKSESLWASFALEFVRKVRAETSTLRRLRGDFVLLVKRLNWRDAWPDVLRAIVQYGVIGIVILGVAVYAVEAGDFASLIRLAKEKPADLFHQVVTVIGSTGGILAIVATATALLLKIREIAGNLFSLDLSRHMRQPDYAREVSFVERVHADFNEILSAYAGRRRLFVFIDDVDRADPTKAAELMQAINLLISEDSRVVFIIGMDRVKVAAAIALKNEKILPFLDAEYPGEVDDADREAALRGLRFGFEYIEKFIQIPFAVPRPSTVNIRKLLGATQSQADTSAPRDARLRALDLEISTDSEAVHELVDMVVEPFEFNPRRVKQFVNTFRLRAFLAHETGLFDAPTNLTLMQLGKIVAIELRWPLLLDHWEEEPDLIRRLETLSAGTSAYSKYWAADDRLVNLLGHGVDGPDARLSSAKCDAVMAVSARVRQAVKDAASVPLPDSLKESSFRFRSRPADDSFADVPPADRFRSQPTDDTFSDLPPDLSESMPKTASPRRSSKSSSRPRK
ncbi:MAG TPA: P-loop NTPase fold protein [Thermoanaerobaculia bacterium]|nr:P-loop NTPase fold protein [Thermoanaerobaculia bacterium]